MDDKGENTVQKFLATAWLVSSHCLQIGTQPTAYSYPRPVFLPLQWYTVEHSTVLVRLLSFRQSYSLQPGGCCLLEEKSQVTNYCVFTVPSILEHLAIGSGQIFNEQESGLANCRPVIKTDFLHTLHVVFYSAFVINILFGDTVQVTDGSTLGVYSRCK